MYRQGLLPRQENVPLTIDAQYVVGFDWARQPELRIVKDFDDHRLWAGLSLKSTRQTTFGSSAGPNCLTGAAASTGTGGGSLEYTQCGGSNVNTIQAYSDSYAPDVIAKIAADPGWGHYELYGPPRFLGGRVSYAAAGSGQNYMTTGEGIGGGMLLPLIPQMLDFQVERPGRQGCRPLRLGSDCRRNVLADRTQHANCIFRRKISPRKQQLGWLPKLRK